MTSELHTAAAIAPIIIPVCAAVKPHNPMVNSGSIIVNALLQNLMKSEMSQAEKFDYVENYIKVSEEAEGPPILTSTPS